MDLPHPSSRKPSKYQPQVGIYIYTTDSFCCSSLFSSAPLLPVFSPRALKHARTPLHLTSHSLRISAPSITLIHQATQGLDRCPPQGSAFFDRGGDLPGDPVVFLVSPKELRGSRRGWSSCRQPDKGLNSRLTSEQNVQQSKKLVLVGLELTKEQD